MSIKFSDESRWRLRSSPLVYVLGQVVISPVLQMKEYIPQIQEELRKQGYPRFQENQIQDVIFGPQPQARISSRWIFLNISNQESVIISNEFIVLETNNYDMFETFVERLRKVVEVVHRVVQINLIERVGLRYVNLIQPNENQMFDESLHKGLLGLPKNREGINRIVSQYESRDQSDIGGELVVRFMETKGRGFLPPDLEANHLKFNLEAIPEDNEIKGILDIDHFLVSQKTFTPERLSKSLWQLHKWTKQAFEMSVTDEALKKWGKEDIRLN